MRNYIVIDTETSGFVTQDTRVVQLGYCLVEDNKAVTTQSIDLFPDAGMYIKEAAFKTHGLTVEHLKTTGSDPTEVFTEFRTILDNLTKAGYGIVGHNLIGFDSKIINIEFGRRGLPKFDFSKAYVTDTGAIYKANELHMFRQTDSEWEFMKEALNRRVTGLFWNLKVCCEAHGIKVDSEKAHDAGYDCELTQQLYEALLSKGIICGTMAVEEPAF